MALRLEQSHVVSETIEAFKSVFKAMPELFEPNPIHLNFYLSSGTAGMVFINQNRTSRFNNTVIVNTPVEKTSWDSSRFVIRMTTRKRRTSSFSYGSSHYAVPIFNPGEKFSGSSVFFDKVFHLDEYDDLGLMYILDRITTGVLVIDKRKY